VRDVADVLESCGALKHPVQVISASGDGGAVAIGLRALLHTVHRRARVTLVVLVNEVFANTGFQYSPAATPFSETSTTPVGAARPGNIMLPLDYVHLAIAAGAGMVAQISPAHGALYVRTVEKMLSCKETAVLFVPAPCISGWKFEDGQTMELALLGARAGVFPTFIWEKGKGGSVKDCGAKAEERPGLEKFLGMQRRFQHLVRKNKETGQFEVRPERAAEVERLKEWTQQNVDRLYKLAQLT
jgi:pyruvate ferredoxin oxidoreductase beta subunit